MSIFSKVRELFANNKSRRKSLNDIGHAPMPFFNGLVNVGDLQAEVTQAAIRDAAPPPTDDAVGLEERGGHLLYETQIIHDLESRAEGVRIARREANITNTREVDRIRAQGAQGRGIPDLQAEINRAIEERNRVEKEERQVAVFVLTGKKDDAWRRLLTDTVPDTTSSWKLHWVTRLVLLALSILESLLGFETATAFVPDDRDLWLRGLIGVLLAAGLFLLPLILGNIIKGPANPTRPRTFMENLTTWIVRVVLFSTWIVLIIGMTSQREVLTMSASEQASGVLRPLSAAIQDPDFVVLSLIMFITGLAILWLHAKENPYQDAVVVANRKLKKLNSRISDLEREKDDSQAQLKMALDQEHEIDLAYEDFINRDLPRLRDQLIDLYRQVYSREVADQNISDLIAGATHRDPSSLPDTPIGFTESLATPSDTNPPETHTEAPMESDSSSFSGPTEAPANRPPVNDNLQDEPPLRPRHGDRSSWWTNPVEPPLPQQDPDEGDNT